MGPQKERLCPPLWNTETGLRNCWLHSYLTNSAGSKWMKELLQSYLSNLLKYGKYNSYFSSVFLSIVFYYYKFIMLFEKLSKVLYKFIVYTALLFLLKNY